MPTDSMLQTQGQRLAYWLDTFAEDQESTLKKLDISYSSFRRFATDPTAKLMTGLLVRLAEVHPDCNLEWLLMGEGEPQWPIFSEQGKAGKVYRNREALVERYEFLRSSLPLWSDAAKAAFLTDAEALMLELHQGNEEILRSIEAIHQLTSNRFT